MCVGGPGSLGLIPNPADETRPLIVGYTLRDLWICDVTQPPTDDVCVFDNYETVEDPIRLPFRKGMGRNRTRMGRTRNPAHMGLAPHARGPDPQQHALGPDPATACSWA